MLKSTIRAIRELLDEQRLLALAVIDESGGPYAGLLPFTVLPDHRSVLIHASRMSRHSQGLAAGARVGILLHEQDGPDKDPLQIKRATFECSVHPYERQSADWIAARDIFLQRFPDSRITFRLGDFTLYRLDFARGLYVGGFGRAVDVEPDDVVRLAESGTVGD
jgi:putative heme iron utilization protein